MYYYDARPQLRQIAARPQPPLDKTRNVCYCMRQGLGNPENSGGCRRQWRQFHSKHYIFSPFGANGPGLPGRVCFHVSNPFAPFSCLGKRGKGNQSPQKQEA